MLIVVTRTCESNASCRGTRAAGSSLTSSTPGRAIGTAKAPLNGRAELAGLPWLRDVVGRAQLDALDHCRDFAHCAHHNHRWPGAASTQPPENIFPAHVRHPEVEQNDVDMTVGNELQRFSATRGGQDVEVIL
jgi:hypothetical protein